MIAATQTQAPSSGLHRFALITSGAAFLLLVAGGLVTSTGSALAVPDWPLSFGRYFPPMTGGILFEHGHRVTAGAVAILTLALAAWTLRRDRRGWVRGLAAASGLGILLQAALGGLTVLFRLPPPVSIAHACLGQTVFCLLLCVAQAASPWFQGAASARLGGLWRLGALAFAAAYVQLVLGAVLRHGGRDVAPHMLWGLAVALIAGAVAVRALRLEGRPPPLARPAALILALLAAQMTLGLAALAVRIRPPAPTDFWRAALPTAHLACGAALLGACAVWTLRAYKLR